MATNDKDAPGGSLYAPLTQVAVAVAAAAGFARVFQGQAATLKLALAGAAAVLLAWAMERRHVLLSVIVTLAGMATAVGLAVFPGTTWFGLPTPSTVRATMDALALVGNTAQVQVAPAVPLPPLLIAAVAAMWSAGFALHSMATRARSPFLSLLPPASLMAFSNIVVDDGVRPAYVLVFLAAALALLFGDALRRVGQWGPISSWRAPFQPSVDGLAARLRAAVRLRDSATGRPARRVAGVALVAALLGAWALPGFRSKGILTLSGDVSPLHVSIDPIVDIKPALLHNRPVQLFSVRATRPAYWRFLSLDRFDGERWTSSNLDASGGQILGRGPLISSGQIDIDPSTDTTYLEQEFVLDKLAQPWLPAAYNPVGVSVPGAQVRYDPVSDVLVSPGGTYPGFTYSVISSLPVPTPAELSAATLPPPAAVQPYVQLPAGTPKEISQIAHRLTDKAPTVYLKVLAIQNYLRENFRYDLRVPAGHDSNHILSFLTKTKAGYCEQFAGSMAVLLRALGIPARVAVGFTPGHFDPKSGLWKVTLQNAHAWVEVLFPNFGWLAFEPTPTRANPVAEPYTNPELVPLGGVQGCAGLTPQQCQQATGQIPGREGQQQNNSNRPRVGDPLSEGLPPPKQAPRTFAAPEPASKRDWIGPSALALLVLLALLIVYLPTSKAIRRRLALARARQPQDRVLAAFDAMAQAASDFGLGRRAHETILEYRVRLREQVPSLDGDLDQLTRLTAAAAYSDVEVTPSDAHLALASARRVTGDIRRSAGPVRRVAGWFRVPRVTERL